MKVLVPYNHDEITVKDVEVGMCFWLQKNLLMKVYIDWSSEGELYCNVLNLTTGLVTRLNNNTLVILENDVAVGEIQSEKKMNKEIDIECRARELCEKLREIGNNEEYKSVFTMAMAHGCNYSGPTYGKELERLEEALES